MLPLKTRRRTGDAHGLHIPHTAQADDQDSGDIDTGALEFRDVSPYGLLQKDRRAPDSMTSGRSMDAVQAHLDLVANLDAQRVSGATDPHVAAQKDQLSGMRQFIASQAAFLEVPDWCGRTPLHHACVLAGINGPANIMAKELILSGANVHSLDACSCTPVTLAMDNRSLVMYMLNHGSKPSRKLARLYGEQCRGSDARNELLEILIDHRWALVQPRRSGGGDGNTSTRSSSSAWPPSSDDGWEDRRIKRFPLHEAIVTDDLDGLEDLLRMGEDPNARDSSGYPPLLTAAFADSVETAHTLLYAGAALGLQDPRRGWTALHVSSSEGHLEVTRLLLTAAADIFDGGGRWDPETFSATTAADGVAPYGNVFGDAAPPRSRAAAADGKVYPAPRSMLVVDARDSMGRRPLHVAAMNGHTPVVKALLRAGADVDSRDRRGRTPLHHAVEANAAGAVRALLRAGSSPDLMDSNGETALHRAALAPAGAVLEALLAAGASAGSGGDEGFTPLHSACQYHSYGTVEVLLRAGAVAGHCWNDPQESPLMAACKAGNRDAVELLLPRLSARQINMRGRTYAVDAGGETPLVAAVYFSSGHDASATIGIVEALLRAGADPSLWTSNGITPLSAVIFGDNTKADPSLGPPLVRALAAAGVDVNGVSSFTGFTPLHHACWNGTCRELVEALLDAGANPRAPCAGMKFMTPLQLAGTSGSAEAVAALLGHLGDGALNAVGASPHRATALACAVRYGRTEVCRLLLEMGADMDLLPPPATFDERGATNGVGSWAPTSLVEMAAQHLHLDALKLLIQAKLFRDGAAGQGMVRVDGGGGIEVS